MSYRPIIYNQYIDNDAVTAAKILDGSITVADLDLTSFTLDDLNDVNSPSPGSDSLLNFDGSDWIDTADLLYDNATGQLDVAGVAGQIKFLFQNAGSNKVFRSTESGNGNDNFSITTHGKLEWGTGGGAQDTNLYRNGAGILKTDGRLDIAGPLNATGAIATILNSPSSQLGFYGAVPGSQWPTIADPVGGATVDAEARAAINDILAMLRASSGVGLIDG